jgi:hypothetical protein
MSEGSRNGFCLWTQAAESAASPRTAAEGNLTVPYKDPQKRREAQRKYREAIEEKARAYLEANRERAKERKAARDRRRKPDDETVWALRWGVSSLTVQAATYLIAYNEHTRYAAQIAKRLQIQTT